MVTALGGESASFSSSGCFIFQSNRICTQGNASVTCPGSAASLCRNVQSAQIVPSPLTLPPSQTFVQSPLTSSTNSTLRKTGGGWSTGINVYGVSTGSWRIPMSRREGLWRSRNMGVEVVEVVQELKRTKGDEDKVHAVMEGKGARLMKSDLLSVLEELQRQEFWFLSLKVFDTVLEEVWYQPDTSLYAKMIECLGQSCETQQAQILFDRMVNEGMQPVQSNFTALIGAYCIAGNYAKGIELLRDMQSKGIAPTRYTYERIVQGCKDGGAPLLAEELRREMEVVVEDYERKPIITRKK